MTTCTRCPSPARWRDADGRQFCGSHVPANGKPLARLPAAAVDLVDVLDYMASLWRNGADGEAIAAAAAEIRRLRALLEAAGDKSGAC
jgi:hypothetical protein